MKKIFINISIFSFIFIAFSSTTNAQTYTVNSLLDDGDGTCTEAKCTFRDAVATSTTGAIIVFDSSLNGQTINLSTSSFIEIDKDITITGSGPENLTINLGLDDNIYLYHTAGDLSISDITFTNGEYLIFSEAYSGYGTGNYNLINIDNVVIDSFANPSGYDASPIYINWSYTDVTIEDSVFSNGNYNSIAGAAIYFAGDEGDAQMTINNSIFHSNTNIDSGGGIRNEGYDLTINNSTFYDNTAPTGSAITDWGNNLTVNNSTFYNNITTDTFEGGAIAKNGGYNLTVNNSTFYDNTSAYRGAAIYNGDGDDTLISDSTFYGNSVTVSGGGAVHNRRGENFVIENSTFYNNSTALGGGAFQAFNGLDIVVKNSTFYGNTATSGADDIYYDSTTARNLSLVNSILASSENSCVDVNFGVITSLGNNIDIGTSCGLDGTGDLSSTDPLLDTDGVADNGGDVYTIALLAGSPAIDAGNDDEAPTTDARGISRVGISDIGAYEFVPEEPEPEAPAIRRSGRSGQRVQRPAVFTQTTTPTIPTTPSTPTTPSPSAFTQDLYFGLTNSDVTNLQLLLISKGYSIPAGATGFFGNQTRQALIQYQINNNITPAVGYFGPITRGMIQN